MMTLRQAIENAAKEGLKPPFDIEYRVTLPTDVAMDTGEYDTLFGYCRWDGENLIPLDQDPYDLDDDILSYEVFDVPAHMAEYEGERALSVTFEGEWMTSGDIEHKTEPEEVQKSTGRGRAERRKKDYAKAIRKRKLAKQIYSDFRNSGREYYDNLHQYSKNKIHGSGHMEQDKTNIKHQRGKGKKFNDVNVTVSKDGLYSNIENDAAHRLGANYKPSERRVIEKMRDQIREYKQTGPAENDSEE